MSDLLKELQEAHRESPSWRLFGLCHQAATRIAALEAQLDEVRRKIQERADWHRCSCPHPCDDYNVFPGGCAGKYRHDYASILSALEATPPAPKVTDEFRQYRRKQIAELRPWSPGERMVGISVSNEDTKAGSPKAGDMIARNPNNHADQWLVAAAYFAENFEPLDAITAAQEAGK